MADVICKTILYLSCVAVSLYFIIYGVMEIKDYMAWKKEFKEKGCTLL